MEVEEPVKLTRRRRGRLTQAEALHQIVMEAVPVDLIRGGPVEPPPAGKLCTRCHCIRPPQLFVGVRGAQCRTCARCRRDGSLAHTKITKAAKKRYNATYARKLAAMRIRMAVPDAEPRAGGGGVKAEPCGDDGDGDDVREAVGCGGKTAAEGKGRIDEETAA